MVLRLQPLGANALIVEPADPELFIGVHGWRNVALAPDFHQGTGRACPASACSVAAQ